MRGSKRLVEEAIKKEMEAAMNASLTRMEQDTANRVAFSCGMGCDVREFSAPYVVDHERSKPR